MPASEVQLSDNAKAKRAVARLLKKHGIQYRDIEIGRSAKRGGKTFVIVWLTNTQRVVGELEMIDRSYQEFGAVVKTEDTFIAKCLMLHA